VQILTSYYCSATQIYYKGDEISHLSPLVIEIPILDNFGILGFWGYLARILLHCKCAESLVVTASHCLEGHRILIWLLDSWTSDARIKKAVVHIYLKGVFTNLTSPNLISADPKQTNKQGSRRYQTLPRCTTHSQYVLPSLTWAKFGCNCGCSACRVLSPLIGIHMTRHLVKTWRHPQNRKYITYRNAVMRRRTEPRSQATRTKIGEVRSCGSRVMWADRQTDRQTNTHTHRNTSHPG